jgi:two-component system, NarL family, invasion response regulator UvrY
MCSSTAETALELALSKVSEPVWFRFQPTIAGKRGRSFIGTSFLGHVRANVRGIPSEMAQRAAFVRWEHRRHETAMTSVLVIDDHPIVLNGCRRVLEDAGVQMVLEARDLVSGYRLYHRRHPDVVVIDLKMSAQDLGGLLLIRRIRLRDSRTQILVFSMHDNAAIVTSALEAGASGYLLKDCAPEELVRAVEQVRTGKPYLSHRVAIEVAPRQSNRQPDSLAHLTQREIRTLMLSSQGRSYDLIAAELGVTYKTVVNTSYQLRLKLAVRSLPELILKAIELLPQRT